LAKICQKLPKNCPKIAPKLPQNCPKIDQNCPKIAQKFTIVKVLASLSLSMSGSNLSGIKAMPRIWNAFIERDLFNADLFCRLNWIQLFHNTKVEFVKLITYIPACVHMNYSKLYLLNLHVYIYCLWKLGTGLTLRRKKTYRMLF
jgi:hypothetical protein